MKKLLKKMMTMVLGLSLLVGCTQFQNQDMKKVAIIQYVEHTSLNTIKAAFDQQMKELGYTDQKNISYVFKNAQGDQNIAASIIQNFKGESFDAIVAIATPAAQSAAVLAKDTPIVFAAVSDPIGAKLASSLEAPDKNITGTSDEIQVEMILQKAMQIDKNLKTLGVIYNKGESNSVTNIRKTKAFAKEKGLTIKEATVTNVNEVQTAIDVLVNQCDAVFAPNDNTIASAMNVVSQTCLQAQKPIYVGADSMVQDGGFLSVGIDYESLGQETARMVDRLLKGETVKNIPIKIFKEDLKIYVNQDVLKTLKIALPQEISKNQALTML